MLVFLLPPCCLYYCKDTLFEAIHNSRSLLFPKIIVVCITAKIHFLKQFTTESSGESTYRRCLYYCKDTLFEAIHNNVFSDIPALKVVCITAKIHFLKQFTTQDAGLSVAARCLYYCKDTLFEAIHNTYLPLNINWYVVCITAKIHFLKQFTTPLKAVNPAIRCLYYCKDTLFEAIHNYFLRIP